MSKYIFILINFYIILLISCPSEPFLSLTACEIADDSYGTQIKKLMKEWQFLF